MNVDPGIFATHPVEQRFEPFDPQFGIHAALDHDLSRAQVGRVLDAREHRVVRHRIAFLVFFRAEKRAEGTVHVADVRVVDRRVDDVGHDVRRIELHAARVRGGPEIVKVALLVEPHAFAEGKASPAGGPVEQTS